MPNENTTHALSADEAESIKNAILAAASASGMYPSSLAEDLIEAFRRVDAATTPPASSTAR